MKSRRVTWPSWESVTFLEAEISEWSPRIVGVEKHVTGRNVGKGLRQKRAACT